MEHQGALKCTLQSLKQGTRNTVACCRQGVTSLRVNGGEILFEIKCLTHYDLFYFKKTLQLYPPHKMSF